MWLKRLFFTWVVFAVWITGLGLADNKKQTILSEQTYKSMQTIHGYMERNQDQKALKALQLLHSKVKNNVYESAVVLQTKGYVFHALGENMQAADSFTKALDKQALPAKVQHEVSYILAQLRVSLEQYRQAVKTLDTWFNNEPAPSSEARILMASAHYSLGHFKQAVPYVEQAIKDISNGPESWYQLLLACYYELSLYESASRLLETMIKRWPKEPNYWTQLASVYQHLKQDQDALSILELAYRQDLLNVDEQLRLAHLYLYLDAPYRAARLLEKEIKAGTIKKTAENWRLLADSWQLAQEHEKAVHALQQAAELSKSGKLYFRLGQTLYELEQWKEAVNALDSAIKSKDLDSKAMPYLMLGIAAYHAHDTARSRQALKRAQTYERTKTQAQWWLERPAAQTADSG